MGIVIEEVTATLTDRRDGERPPNAERSRADGGGGSRESVERIVRAQLEALLQRRHRHEERLRAD